MNFQLDLSLDQIEGKSGNVESGPSGLAERVRIARSKKLSALEPKDMRCLIIQRIGLEHVMPITLDILEEDPLILSEYYRGDLLRAVLEIDFKELESNPSWYAQLNEIRIEAQQISEELNENILPKLNLFNYSKPGVDLGKV